MLCAHSAVDRVAYTLYTMHVFSPILFFLSFSELNFDEDESQSDQDEELLNDGEHVPEEDAYEEINEEQE